MHEPYPILCVTRQPCEWCAVGQECHHGPPPMVKRFETRTWPCPPNLIGSRIALHATQRSGIGLRIGDYTTDISTSSGYYMRLFGDTASTRIPLPLGAVVGSAVVEACWRIKPPQRNAVLWSDDGHKHVNVSDQIPYGDFTPGRYAWLLGDAAPVQERCPWCWDPAEKMVTDDQLDAPDGARIELDGWWYERHGDSWMPDACTVCNLVGRCEPIPAKGRQRIWNWQP